MSCYKFIFIYTAAVYNNNYLKVFHIQRFHRDVMILCEQTLGNREEDELLNRKRPQEKPHSESFGYLTWLRQTVKNSQAKSMYRWEEQSQ